MTITSEKLDARGIPEDSYFVAESADGTRLHERMHNWSDYSEDAIVTRLGTPFQCRLSTFPLRSISVYHGASYASIQVPPGAQAYQAIRGRVVAAGGQTSHEIAGRTIGIVKDGVVIEEQYIDATTGEVHGIRN